MNDSLLTDVRVRVMAAVALGALAFMAVVAGLTGLSEMRYIGAGVSATNTISISGEGEVFAVPDIATFTVTVREEAKTVAAAQGAATKKINDTMTYLRGAGVEEKDIKTENYNVNPQYDWVQEKCTTSYCGGKQVLRGYEVYQTLAVKVRKTDTAGEILAGVGGTGVTEVSGLSFTIDDDEALKAEARKQAIEDAETKAEVLADDLGVSLVRIVGFSEGTAMPVYNYARAEKVMMADAAAGAPAPELPIGENKIVSNVTVTYEIR